MNAILELGKVPSPPTWSTTLLIDAMYFHSAKGCCDVAKISLKAIGKVRKAFADLRNEEADISDRYDGDSWKAYDGFSSKK